VARVNADYRDGVRRIQQRILGMSNNNNVERFRNTATDKLLKSLATKYELKAVFANTVRQTLCVR